MERNMSVDELAQKLGVVTMTARGYLWKGMPHDKHFNGRVYVNFEECMEWLKENYKNKKWSNVK